MPARILALVVVLSAAGCLIAASQRFVADVAPLEPRSVRVSYPTREGEAVWYTSLPAAHADRLSNAFSDRTGIGVRVVRASAFAMRERLDDELAAGECAADVVTVADVGAYVELEARGELAPLAGLGTASIPARFRPSDYWVGFSGFGVCMAYDETRVADPPERWEDLLDPKWRGELGLESIESAGSQYGQYYLLRELLGKAFWQRLLTEQQPRIYATTNDLADALLEGEIAVAAEFSTSTAHNYRAMKGVPIRAVCPTEGVPYVLTPTAIPARAPHPREARAFTQFLLSREGQQLMQRLTFRYPVRDDVAPLEGMPALDTLTLLLPESAEDYARARDAYVIEFGQILDGGPS